MGGNGERKLFNLEFGIERATGFVSRNEANFAQFERRDGGRTASGTKIPYKTNDFVDGIGSSGSLAGGNDGRNPASGKLKTVKINSIITIELH